MSVVLKEDLPRPALYEGKNLCHDQEKKSSGAMESRKGTKETERKRRRKDGQSGSSASFCAGGESPRFTDMQAENSKSITQDDVGSLIEEAQRVALHQLEDEDRHAEGRSPSIVPAHSQQWRGSMMTQVQQFFSSSPSRVTVGDAGRVILDVIKILVDNPCRSQPTGQKKSVFPLPLPLAPGNSAGSFQFFEAMVRALNSLYGCTERRESSPTTALALKRLGSLVEDSALLREPLVSLDFKDFFDNRGLDYSGDEVKIARNVTWEGIAASLPDEVGTLDIRDFCQGGVLEYIEDFEGYLVPEEFRTLRKVPKTMILADDWDEVATGLVQRGLCEVMLEQELYHVGPTPLLNGLFAVTKDEFCGSTELLRLIMNLRPLNDLVRPLEGDTCTLPTITNLGSMFLEEDEILCISSADIRCFFYLFRLPRQWYKYLAFGKPVPQGLLPQGAAGSKGYLVSRVLPMGFTNSVAIAQHIHRNVTRRTMAGWDNSLGGHQELRRDRPMSSSQSLFRIYLDNFDQLERLNRSFARLVRGEVSPVVQQLRDAYEKHQLPIHPKKSVYREWTAEVQGALVQGEEGRVLAKPPKVSRYVSLVLNVLLTGKASQRELQVVGGGLVYASMFRRPLLCGLNALWRCIIELEDRPKGIRVFLPRVVLLELARFVALLPLAFMDLRAPVVAEVTASDASTTGGGVCISRGLSPFGAAAVQASVRGDVPEPHDFCQVLTIGVFDGISALRVSAEVLGLPMAGHISVEKNEQARRVTEANFPETISIPLVEDVTEEVVLGWSLRFSNVGLVILGGGPPCQGVSGLNSDRRGPFVIRVAVCSHISPGLSHC